MDKKAIEWLYGQLPELVAKGVLSQENADQLRQHYGSVGKTIPSKTLLTAFGVIGAIMIGLGIILILAHNWENLSRVNRLIVSVGLLVAAQALTGIALYFKPDSAGWRESTAVLHTLMIGASIALVSQTYHLTDDTDAFLLVWMLLSLPLIYLVKSNGVCLLYLAGVTAWTFTNHIYLEKQLVWVLLLLALPYCRRQIQDAPGANITKVLCWVFSVCFFLCFAAVFERFINNYGMLVYSSLFSVSYILSSLWQGHGDPRQAPLKLIGLVGGIGISFLLTTNSLWRHLTNVRPPTIPDIILVVVLLILVFVGNAWLLRKRAGKVLAFSFAPLVVGAAYLLQAVDPTGVSSTILMNSYLLVISIGIIVIGVRRRSLGLVNIGMLLLAAIITARFLDSSFSFITRGIVFVLLGAGFLITNLVLTVRKSEDYK